MGFQYVEQGIRVRGQWYPIVRMEWAQGDRLDRFVEDHLDAPEMLLAWPPGGGAQTARCGACG